MRPPRSNGAGGPGTQKQGLGKLLTGVLMVLTSALLGIGFIALTDARKDWTPGQTAMKMVLYSAIVLGVQLAIAMAIFAGKHARPWIERVRGTKTFRLVGGGVLVLVTCLIFTLAFGRIFWPESVEAWHVELLQRAPAALDFVFAAELWLAIVACIGLGWGLYRVLARLGWKRTTFVVVCIVVGYFAHPYLFGADAVWMPKVVSMAAASVVLGIPMLLVQLVINIVNRVRGDEDEVNEEDSDDDTAEAIHERHPVPRRTRRWGWVMLACGLVAGALYLWYPDTWWPRKSDAPVAAALNGEGDKADDKASDGGKKRTEADGGIASPEPTERKERPASMKLTLPNTQDANTSEEARKTIEIQIIPDPTGLPPHGNGCAKVPDLRPYCVGEQANKATCAFLQQELQQNGPANTWTGKLHKVYFVRFWEGHEEAEPCMQAAPVTLPVVVDAPASAAPPSADAEDAPPPPEPVREEPVVVAAFEGAVKDGTQMFPCTDEGRTEYEQGVIALCKYTDGHTPCSLAAIKRRFKSIREACGEMFLTREREEALLGSDLDYTRP